MSGQPDMANVTPPTISEVAAKRGWQTLAQGLGIDVAVAVALVVATILPGVETWDDVVRLWPAWLLLMVKSCVQALVAWVIRRYSDRSGMDIQPQSAAHPDAPPRRAQEPGTPDADGVIRG